MTDQRITVADVDAAQAARYSARQSLETELRAELTTAYRPGGIVARAIADELERLADSATVESPTIAPSVLRVLAAEWRDNEP